MTDKDEFRRLLSSAITILESVEDDTETLPLRLRLLDLIDIFRTARRRIDSASIAESAEAYKHATQELRDSTSELRKLEGELQEALAQTEARLQRIGHIAKLIKAVIS